MSELMCKQCNKTLDTKLWGTGSKKLCSCKDFVCHLEEGAKSE